MKRIVTFFALFIFCCSMAFASPSLIRISNLTRAEILDYANQGHEVARVGEDYIELVVDQQSLAKIQESKAAFQPVVSNLDGVVAKVLTESLKSDISYHTYQTMTDKLKGWANDYSHICKLESIGKSWEGREIWALKISDNPELNEKQPAALIMGAHHAREWTSYEVPIEAARLLLEGYGNDEYLTRLVDTREIWFVPMVNPDGVEHCMNEYKYWRKNRRKIDNRTYGVDLNRNYGYKWGGAGASSSPSSSTYRGPEAFSEPETVAIRDFATREGIAASISFHSYSELVLYPWSYASNVYIEHEDILSKMAKDMAKFNGYVAKNSAGLYPAAGETDDFMYGELKSLSFTFELGKTFIPPVSEIAVQCEQNVPAIFYLIDKAGTYGLVTPAGDEFWQNLDTHSAVNALSELENAASINDRVAARLRQIETMLLARAVAEHEETGVSITSQILQSASGSAIAESVSKQISETLRFNSIHQ